MTTSLAARARIYGWLSRLFAPPTGTPGPRRLSVTALRASGDDRLAAAAHDVEANYPAGDQTELQVGYTRLFVGWGHVPASPYGSVYRDGGVLMGPTTQAVAACYQEAGLAVDPSAAELPDHISLVCGFLHLLTLREAIARRQGRLDQAKAWAESRERFEAEHLTTWGLAFAQQVEQAEPHPLYGSAARLLAAWISRI